MKKISAHILLIIMASLSILLGVSTPSHASNHNVYTSKVSTSKNKKIESVPGVALYLDDLRHKDVRTFRATVSKTARSSASTKPSNYSRVSATPGLTKFFNRFARSQGSSPRFERDMFKCYVLSNLTVKQAASTGYVKRKQALSTCINKTLEKHHMFE